MSSQDALPPAETLCALLIGHAVSEKAAAEHVANSQDCPYVAFYTALADTVVGLIVIPSHKRWWIKHPEEHPELLGMNRIKVLISDVIQASSPWSRGLVEPVLPAAPCGTDCMACPQYRSTCQGCPATVYYETSGS